jgi:hypothetical protein
MLMEALLRQAKAYKNLDPFGTLKVTPGRRDSVTSTLVLQVFLVLGSHTFFFY